ncbi:hypothetical protein DNTS_028998 [Danionella cerebrum]|uniref:B30.2/SPRY domain-containing protein n=1 Tax=Danionella cerebrum TaxID=2873325 RepID=A0A553QR24_9TELE|nr:hypothetical protein DNTS_028998 [Danionella translucida]
MGKFRGAGLTLGSPRSLTGLVRVKRTRVRRARKAADMSDVVFAASLPSRETITGNTSEEKHQEKRIQVNPEQLQEKKQETCKQLHTENRHQIQRLTSKEIEENISDPTLDQGEQKTVVLRSPGSEHTEELKKKNSESTMKPSEHLLEETAARKEGAPAENKSEESILKPPQNHEAQKMTTQKKFEESSLKPSGEERSPELGSPTESECKIQEDLQQPEDPQKPQTEEDEPLGPDDVTCDSCIERQCRARKSCLTCLVSYCASHLRPHLESARFRSHRLVEPLRDIDSGACELHRRPLEFYCRADERCACSECEEEEHRGESCALVSITDARRSFEMEIVNKQTEMLKTMTAAENAINKLKLNTESIEASVQEVRGVIEAQFGVLLSSVEQVQKEVNEILEMEERQALRQADGIRIHLQQRCSELKKTHTHLEKITRNKNDIDFLQKYSDWKREAVDVSLPGVYFGLMDRLQSFSLVIKRSTKEMCESLLAVYTNKLKDLCKNDNARIKTTVYSLNAAKQSLTIPQPNTRDDFLKYMKPVTLDEDTAHQFLRLTEERKKVTNTTPWQHSYPDLPQRFQHFRQVLANQSFYLGRHYFEVDMKGEGTHVGMTYQSIERKASGSNGCISGNNFSWCLQWNGRSFSAWHSDVETPLNCSKTTRIGVYVDHSSGVLAFYDVENDMALMHRYQAEFREPLYPAFWLPKKENVVLLEPGSASSLTSPSPSPVTSPR